MPIASRTRLVIRTATVVASLAMIAASSACFSDPATSDTDVSSGSLADGVALDGATFTVGSKEFTEQLILCQITSMALRSAGATVTEKCGIQGSNGTRAALTSGSIDLYWEYTGTAWINYLQHTDPINDSAELYAATSKEDLDKNKIRWLKPAPANNTYAIVVRATTGKDLGVVSLSDYAKLVQADPTKATICVGNEFASRNDGFPGLQKAYGVAVPDAQVAKLADGAIVSAVAKNDPCNFGMAATTDGRIKALDLAVLTDDKQFFPVYNPAPTVRDSVYNEHPDIAKVLDPIASALTDSVLQELNGKVDLDGEEPGEVAEAWLKSQGFIGS